MFYCLLYIILAVKCEQVIVKTTIGKIIGETKFGIHTFLGIPYALVDVDFPFGAYSKHNDFMTPFKAINGTISCPQLEESVYQGTLQCLTLNIYAPQKVNRKVPVLVWFHGSFTRGSANDHRSQFLVRQNIILVTVNYRLGPYGFICPKEHMLPGNQGMRDQQTALEWIHRHIEAFGGNSASVTIGGSGNGGGMAELHLYSKSNKPLFNKVIIQSGSIFSPGFFVPPDPEHIIAIAVRLGKSIGKTTNPRDVIPFLNPKDPGKVVQATEFTKRDIGVCKEPIARDEMSNFITDCPFSLNLPENMTVMKVLIGYNSMEMLGMFAKNNTMAFYEDSGDIITEALEKSFNLSEVNVEILSSIVKRFYLGNNNYSPESIIYLSEMLSDFYICNSVERSINRLVKAGATVYKYLFSYKGASEYQNIPGSGVPQGEELKYLFDEESPLTGEEQPKMKNKMVMLWSNFIKFGNPIPDGKPLAWKPVNEPSRPYLNIDVNVSMMDDTFQRRNSFWHLLWHSYQSDSVLC